MVSQGVAPRVVMEQLGHSHIGFTMNTYAHVMPTMLRAAADALNVALDAARTATRWGMRWGTGTNTAGEPTRPSCIFRVVLRVFG
jgi:hypothetical protein